MAAILDLLITATPHQNKNVTIVLSMVEKNHLDIYMAILIGLYVSDSFAPIPLKIGPLGPI